MNTVDARRAHPVMCGNAQVVRLLQTMHWEKVTAPIKKRRSLSYREEGSASNQGGGVCFKGAVKRKKNPWLIQGGGRKPHRLSIRKGTDSLWGRGEEKKKKSG